MRRLVPALAAAVLLFTGCSDDEPDVVPTASADPAETPPPMPELARDDSPAGAEAFVRHYIDVLNYAALTGDTAALEDLSSAECSGCDRYIELFRSTYANGGHFKGGEWNVQDLNVEFDANQTEQYVTAVVLIDDGAEKPSRDAEEIPTSVSESTVTFALQAADRPKMTQFGLGGLE